jgi:hypothetical protein
MKMASIALAAMLLAAPAAMAQTSIDKSTTPPEKSMTAPEKSTPSASMSSDMFYSHKSGEVRASKLIGSTVRNAANESVGNINELVLDQEGKVAAVVIGVGGFLGIGEREVAMNYSGLKFAKDSNGSDVITANATRDQLKSAPEWKWEAPSGSVTKGTPSGSAPK